MKLFTSQGKKKTQHPLPGAVPETVDKRNWTGKEFQFLITGNIVIPESDYDMVMTPNSFECSKQTLDNWPIYKVGKESFCFFRNDNGIQIGFSETITYEVARQIADEILENIKATGQSAHIIVIGIPDLYRKENKPRTMR